jgi:hypothetical protein
MGTLPTDDDHRHTDLDACMGGGPLPAKTGQPQPETQAEEPALHVASGQDATEAAHRAERLAAIIVSADDRDRAAEQRDRAAEDRDQRDGDRAAVDRGWAGRDRDRAAEDRADLIELLQRHEPKAPGDESDSLS